MKQSHSCWDELCLTSQAKANRGGCTDSAGDGGHKPASREPFELREVEAMPISRKILSLQVEQGCRGNSNSGRKKVATED